MQTPDKPASLLTPIGEFLAPFPTFPVLRTLNPPPIVRARGQTARWHSPRKIELLF